MHIPTSLLSQFLEQMDIPCCAWSMYFSSQGLVFVLHMRSSTHLHSSPQNCGCSQVTINSLQKIIFIHCFFTSCFQTLLSSCLEGYVLLSTHHEMSHAQNMTGAHVQVFMVDMTSCYFPSWKHSRSALANYTLLEMLDVFCLRAVVCCFYQ
jgi:hypothetical protein